MADEFRVSQSKVKTYRRCHRAYHNKYVEKLKRRRVARPLTFGRMVHEMLEAFAGGDDPFEVLEAINLRDAKLFASEREEYGEIVDDIHTIMTEYFKKWPEEDLQYLRVNKKSAEHEFNIELMPNVIWNGKLDGFGKTPNRLKWLIEHKTFNRKPSDDDRWRNLQSITYFRAIDILGWPQVDGVCWDYIGSKAPAQPGLLADKSMSQKMIKTLPTAVEKFIDRHLPGNNVDYSTFVKKTEQNYDDWFMRVFTPIHTEAVDAIFADFESTIRRMVDDHGKVRDMNIERHCGWCEYEPLCRAELLGGDIDFIKAKEYTTDGSTVNKKKRVRR